LIPDALDIVEVIDRIQIARRMVKKAVVLTRPPQRAKTRISPNKTAASEEARRYIPSFA